MLFRCPIYKVREIVPVSELLVWQEIWNKSPWGFEALDRSLANATFNIVGSNVKLKRGIGVDDFRYPDAYRDGFLGDEEFCALSDLEKGEYAARATLTQSQFDALTDEQQRSYSARLVENMKMVMS